MLVRNFPPSRGVGLNRAHRSRSFRKLDLIHAVCRGGGGAAVEVLNAPSARLAKNEIAPYENGNQTVRAGFTPARHANCDNRGVVERDGARPSPRGASGNRP